MPEHSNNVKNTQHFDSVKSATSETKPHRSLFERLTALISPEPENRIELLEVLQDAHERNLIDISKPIEEWMPYVISTAHSRFPAVEGSRDKVVGVLLAKDLLRYYFDDEFDVRTMLRPAIFIPESKRLNVLLRDFRANRNHMAMVVDEYGGVDGLITIEDVLEQIVGDIEDEYDFDEEEDNILLINPEAQAARWRVKGLTEIGQFNDATGSHFSDEDVDTIGGLVANHLARVPHKGDKFTIGRTSFEVLRADPRQVHVLLVERLPELPLPDEYDAG